jgi:hypothetical protein
MSISKKKFSLSNQGEIQQYCYLGDQNNEVITTRQLLAVDWFALLRSDYVEEWYELSVSKYIVKNSTVKCLHKECCNVDDNKTREYHVRPLSESNQCLYDTAFHRFAELRCDLKSLHRLKSAQYIVRIESGLKNNPWVFFKYTYMKLNAIGGLSSMFMRRLCVRDSKSIENVWPDNTHKMS